MKKLIYILLVVLFTQTALALTVSIDPTSVTKQLSSGDSFQQSFDYTILNEANNSVTANIVINDIDSSWYSLNPGSISVPANSSVLGTIILTFDIPIGTPTAIYSGTMFVSSTSIPISLDITRPGSCKIYTLPIPLSKTLETGSSATQTIDVYISKYCSSPISIATNQPQMEKPINFDQIAGLVEPGNKFTVTVNYNTLNVQKGTYSDKIIITGLDDDEEIYYLDIPISLTVTGMISPITNFSLSDLPTCSLSSSDFYINSSYTLTCSNVNPNIEVDPEFDTKYIIATTASEASDQYVMDFKLLNVGNTKMKVLFKHKNAAFGSWEQDIRIVAGSTPLPGTVMKFEFYPILENLGDNSTLNVLIVDNSTNNVIGSASLYINGVAHNWLEESIIVNSDKKYELRASAAGYAGIVKNFTIAPKTITLTVSPSIDVFLGDILNITTNPSDAIITYDDSVITNLYRVSTLGVHKIKATKEGYVSAEVEITVLERVTLLTELPEIPKINKEYIVGFNKNATWQLLYKENAEADIEEVKRGTGTEASVTFTKPGIWILEVSGVRLYDTQIKKSRMSIWIWIIIGAFIVIGVVIFLIRRRNASSGGFMGGSTFTDSGDTSVEGTPM